MDNEEVIRENMEKTRESLTDKLEALENKLVGSVEDATTAVRETVTSVKESMHEGVESVKEAVDIPAHVEKRPWLMFGGAVFGGYILASLLHRERQPATVSVAMTPRQTNLSDGNGHAYPTRPVPPTPIPAPAPTENSWLSAVAPEIRQLKGLALGVTLGTVREMLTKEVPPPLADQLRAVIDGVTKKIGGEPIAAADLPFNESASCATASTRSPLETPQARW